MIGRRLKLARAASGLSLRGLQSAIDGLVTAQAIGKYERNESMPGSQVLLAMARALNVSVENLAGDSELVLQGVEFRKRAVTRRKDEAQIEATVLHLIERYLSIEAILGLSSEQWARPPGSPYPLERIADADHVADTVRGHWGLGLDPITDLAELLEERGIKVLILDLKGIAGLTAHVGRPGKTTVPAIVVSSQEWGERQRFTLAHELGHLILRVGAGVDGEKAAHRFAGALLMPAERLRVEIGRRRQLVSRGELLELKKLFGVSVQALTYRCRDLEIFSDKLFRRLFREFSRLGWRTPPYEEPFAMKPAKRPRRFERLCYRALAEGAISEAKAAELLDLTVRDLRACMSGPV